MGAQITNDIERIRIGSQGDKFLGIVLCKLIEGAQFFKTLCEALPAACGRRIEDGTQP